MIVFEGSFLYAYMRLKGEVALDPSNNPRDTIWTIDEWFIREAWRVLHTDEGWLKNVRIRVEIEEAGDQAAPPKDFFQEPTEEADTAED